MAKATSLEDRLRSLTRVDEVMDRMVPAIEKVKNSQGSTVKLPKAELDLLAQVEIARDIMTEVLQIQTDRALLRDIFGGNCSRIARIRAICESIEFSEMNKGDQRLRTCLRACQSVEKVLVDLGDGEALRQAQAAVAAAGFDVLLVSLPSDEGQESSKATPRGAGRVRSESNADDGLDRCAERLLTLVRADAARMETQLKGDLSSYQERLQKDIAGCDSRFQDFSGSMQVIVEKWEEKLDSFERRLNDLPGELSQRSAQSEARLRQAEDKFACRIAELERQRTVDAAGADIELKLQLDDVKTSVLHDVQVRFQSMETRVSGLEKGQSAFETRCKYTESRLTELTDKLDELKVELIQGWEFQLSLQLENVVTQCEAGSTAIAAELAKEARGSRFEQESRSNELEKMIKHLRHDCDIDSVWSSFAHVGDLIHDIETKLEKVCGLTPAAAPAGGSADSSWSSASIFSSWSRKKEKEKDKEDDKEVEEPPWSAGPLRSALAAAPAPMSM